MRVRHAEATETSWLIWLPILRLVVEVERLVEALPGAIEQLKLSRTTFLASLNSSCTVTQPGSSLFSSTLPCQLQPNVLRQVDRWRGSRGFPFSVVLSRSVRTSSSIRISGDPSCRSGQEILLGLGVSADRGLDAPEAARRLEAAGPNVLQKARAEGPLRLLWRQINNPLIYVLLGSAVLAIVMGKAVDGLVVL